jgi:hypothetical protein
MAVFAIPAMVIGGAISAAGSIASGAAAKKAGKAQQRQFEEEARRVEITTKEEKKKFLEGAREFQTEQLAAMGAAGATIDTTIDPASYVTTSGGITKKTQRLLSKFSKAKVPVIGNIMKGKASREEDTKKFGENITAEMSTPLKMAIQTARRIEEDRFRLLREGKWQAQSLRTSGQIARQGGNAAFAAGMFGAASSLLGTAYDVSIYRPRGG